MSWEGSDRAKRLPPGWAKLRRQILERDGYLCQATGCTAQANEVDHRQRGDNHDPSNLWSLCSHHHAIKTKAEATTARLAAMPRKHRPAEPHPGLRP